MLGTLSLPSCHDDYSVLGLIVYMHLINLSWIVRATSHVMSHYVLPLCKAAEIEANDRYQTSLLTVLQAAALVGAGLNTTRCYNVIKV